MDSVLEKHLLAQKQEIDGLASVINGTGSELVTPTRQVQSKALVAEIPIYTFPDTLTPGQKLKVMTVLTLCGRSTSESGNEWRTFVLSYAVLAFPELEGLLTTKKMREYRLEALTVDKCTYICNVFDRVNTADNDDASEAVELPPGLPREGIPDVTTELTGSCELTTPYCYFALILFLCGKTIGSLNRVAIVSRRPKALIAEFSAHNGEFVLTGEGRLSDHSHSMINSAWGTCVEPRIAIVDHFASIASGPSSTAERIITHIMGLLKNSGMSYVHHIVRVLIDLNFTATMPGLVADYSAFKRSVARAGEIPEYFRPYYKMAYGNQCSIFRRSDMPALTTIAIIYGAQSQESMRQYTIERGYSTMVDLWIARANEKGLSIARASDQAIVSAAY